ncbi:MAG: response regulator [Desulfarculus sp.]|jgi:CheY-like chemotaxis protein|nr:MAG: response regulator [Desulfarculus sp.]
MGKDDQLILIVDDEPEMCWALEHILRKTGRRVIKALSGQEALRLAEAHNPALAFVDAKLPDMEGLELAGRLRELASGLRIVVVSGYFYKDDDAVQKALSEKIIADFISKPFKNEDILRSLP